MFLFFHFVRRFGFFQTSFKDIAQFLAGTLIFKPKFFLNPIILHLQLEILGFSTLN